MDPGNNYLKYTSMAAEMLVTIGAGALLGHLLDLHFKLATPYCTAAFSLVFVVIAMYRAIRTFL